MSAKWDQNIKPIEVGASYPRKIHMKESEADKAIIFIVFPYISAVCIIIFICDNIFPFYWRHGTMKH